MALKERGHRKGYWFKTLSKGKKIALISVLVILLLVGLAVAFVLAKLSKLDTEEIPEDEIEINEEILDDDIGVGYTNFVLFGADSRSNDVESDLNTDSIIIVSLNNETKEIKLVSVYRDTLLDVKNNNIQKCNSAYRRGGAKQAINMLNTNLDMNIQKYVTVNFTVVSDVVDMLGGVEVTLTDKEADAINDYLWETAKVANKEYKLVSGGGRQTLDGVQATTYARIRKGVGDDEARTGRQRELIRLVLQKAVRADLKTINKIIDKVFPQISTNLTLTEVLRYAKSLTKYEIGESSAFPFEKRSGTVGSRGSCVWSADLEEDVSKLHEVLFGTVDYEPSSKVQSIDSRIKSIVGSVKTTSTNKTTSTTKTTETSSATTTEAEEPADTSTEMPDTTDTSVTEQPTTGATEPETPTTGGEVTTPENPTTPEEPQPSEVIEGQEAPEAFVTE